MREKLIKLLRQTRYEYRHYIAMKDYEKRIAKTDEEFLAIDDSIVGEIPFCADFLIANGVTIQKWIPVTERLPDKDTLVLCIGSKGGMFLGYVRSLYGDETTAYTIVPNARGGRYTKYWMPLPEPPKGD